MGGRGAGGHGNSSGELSNAQLHDLYEKMQDSWAGATINATTGDEVPQGADKYAVTTGETTSIDERASYSEFKAAYNKVASENGSGRHVGVFHDDSKHTIDFNRSTVTTKAGVDRLYKAGNPVSGGAYHFKTGNGYWPQGRPKNYGAYAPAA